MTEQNKALRIGIITAAVVGAVAIPATALAANSTGIGMHTRAETSAALHAQVHAGQDFAGPARGRGGQSGEHLTALATALGTTPEALKEAMQAAREETKPDTKPAD
ncbi:MAG: hypothetical protein O2822_05235, partial [Chloroflexi bacterium]|nr:hypothetical protein [Chloroflexota bacterium]